MSNPYDTEALRRIYNEPKRGIGKATWDKLEAIARQKDIPLWDVLNTIDKDDSLGSAARKKLIELASLLNTLRKFAAEESSIATIIDEVWRCSGYSSMIAADEQKEAKSEIMEQFYDTAIDFDRYYAENYLSLIHIWSARTKVAPVSSALCIPCSISPPTFTPSFEAIFF